MKVYPDCIVCNQRQALDAARRVTGDESVVFQVVRAVAQAMLDFPFDKTPSESTAIAHRLVREITGAADPYREDKMQHDAIAVELYPTLKAAVEQAPDPLWMAVKVAAAANLIDLVVYNSLGDIQADIRNALTRDFAINDYGAFARDVAGAKNILFIGDNAGEVGFDRILVETLGPARVTYVVRERPVVNDATYEDAAAVGLDRVTRVITTGDDSVGLVFERCSAEFMQAYGAADLIIGKGQANYESLSGVNRPVYFLLQAKCVAVARDLGVAQKSLVLKRGKDDTTRKAEHEYT